MTWADKLLKRFEELPPATGATSRMNIPLGTPQNLGLVTPIVQGELTLSTRKKKKKKKKLEGESMTRAEKLLETSEAATVAQEAKMFEKQVMAFRKKMEGMGQAGLAGPEMMKAVVMATPKDAHKFLSGWLKSAMGNM